MDIYEVDLATTSSPAAAAADPGAPVDPTTELVGSGQVGPALSGWSLIWGVCGGGLADDLCVCVGLQAAVAPSELDGSLPTSDSLVQGSVPPPKVSRLVTVSA